MSTKKTAKAPKKKKPIVTERILARFDFTPAEMADLGGQSGRLTNEINTLREDAKGVAADFKGKIELKESARNSLATKLSNGYEMREATALVLFDTKKREKRFVDPKNQGKIFKTETMTENDWQLPMFRKEEVVSKRPKPDTAEKAPAGKTNVGDKISEAVDEAAKASGLVDIDLDGAISGGVIPKALIKRFKLAAKEAGWKENVIKSAIAHAETFTDAGIGEMAEALRPYCIKK